MSLSSKAILVNLSISQWSARKYDRKETAELALKHGTGMEVARVNKSLLPFADTLDAIHKKTGAIRTEFYKTTLPWGLDGLQIIRADGYMSFIRTMQQQMDEWRGLVESFLDSYPALRDEARLLLNGLYSEADYPDVSTLRQKFDINLRFLPVPDATDWRVDLAEEEVESLRKQIEAQVSDAGAAAMREAWRRVYDTVVHIHERLSQPDAVFRDSLVNNAVELCRLLPTLNITDDPNLERMRQAIEGSVCQYEPDQLRNHSGVRQDVAQSMADIMSKMGAFYGAA